MARMLAILLSVAIATMSGGLVLLPAALAQQVPASAVIRGENIRLRLEPAAASEDVAILQRGDAITITGEVTTADGLLFYPVEVVQTGDTGWVRDIFIKPSSIVPLPAAELPAAEPAPADETVDQGNNARRERPARQRRNRDAAAEDAAAADAAAAEDAAAAADAAADQAAADAAAAEEAAKAAEDAAATEEPAPAAPPADAVAVATGSGNARSERFALESGRYRVNATLEADAAGNLVCDVFGPDDFTFALFDEPIDGPQSWTGQTNLRIRGQGGDFYVECAEAPGAWTFAFTPAQGGNAGN